MVNPEQPIIEQQWLSDAEYERYDNLLLQQFLRNYDDEGFFFPTEHDNVMVVLDGTLEDAVKHHASWEIHCEQEFVFDAQERRIWLVDEDRLVEPTEDEYMRVVHLLIEVEEFVKPKEGQTFTPSRGC